MEHLKQYSQPLLNSGSTHSGIRFDIPTEQLAGSMISSFGSNEVHRTVLAEGAYMYANDQTMFVADKVAPMAPVTSLAGKYRKWNERNMYDRPDTGRGKDSPPTRVSNGSEFENYDLSGRALSFYMSHVDRDDAINQYGSVERWRLAITRQLTHLLLIDRELTVASLLQTSGNYAAGFSTTASPLWSDASADYQDDVFTGEDAIYAPRDVIVFGYNVARQCQKSSQIKGASVSSAGSGKRKDNMPYVDLQSVSNYFDSEIIVGGARYNSAPESTTMTLSRIWADYAIIMHNASSIGGAEFGAPFCRTFKLQSASFPNVEGFTVKSVMDTAGSMAGGEILMVGYWSQEKIFAQKNGYLLKCL